MLADVTDLSNCRCLAAKQFRLINSFSTLLASKVIILLCMLCWKSKTASLSQNGLSNILNTICTFIFRFRIVHFSMPLFNNFNRPSLTTHKDCIFKTFPNVLIIIFATSIDPFDLDSNSSRKILRNSSF